MKLKSKLSISAIISSVIAGFLGTAAFSASIDFRSAAATDTQQQLTSQVAACKAVRDGKISAMQLFNLAKGILIHMR